MLNINIQDFGFGDIPILFGFYECLYDFSSFFFLHYFMTQPFHYVNCSVLPEIPHIYQHLQIHTNHIIKRFYSQT